MVGMETAPWPCWDEEVNYIYASEKSMAGDVFKVQWMLTSVKEWPVNNRAEGGHGTVHIGKHPQETVTPWQRWASSCVAGRERQFHLTCKTSQLKISIVNMLTIKLSPPSGGNQDSLPGVGQDCQHPPPVGQVQEVFTPIWRVKWSADEGLNQEHQQHNDKQPSVQQVSPAHIRRSTNPCVGEHLPVRLLVVEALLAGTTLCRLMHGSELGSTSWMRVILVNYPMNILTWFIEYNWIFDILHTLMLFSSRSTFLCLVC